MTTLKIAIIGAGPAGCTLARILLLSAPSFDITIFEGEASANARPQGGSLDLHSKTGLAALKKAGLYNEFLKHARFDGEAFQVTDKHLRRYLNMPGTSENTSRGRPEIDRHSLRQLLVDSLPEDMIKWNHRLRSIDDDLTLHFDHDTYSGYDLVIGTDGAWSKVRHAVSSVTPSYAGVTGVRSGIKDCSKTHPELHKLVNRGNLLAFSDQKSLMLQQTGNDIMGVFTWDVKPEGWIRKLPSVHSDLMAHTKEQFSSFDPRLTDAFDFADVDAVPMNMYMLPIGHSWKHKPGVTLIGDAAHLMTPFAGEGVNLAMEDSMNLATAIITAATTLSTTTTTTTTNTKKSVLSTQIARFETDMFARVKPVQQLTFNSMNHLFFTPGAPATSIDKYVYGFVADSLPWFIAPLLWPLVCGYFFLFRFFEWGIDAERKRAEAEAGTKPKTT
ncbi:hypothetical protein BDV97DRAFT_403380 [Delphinella strobiligena]|nr:hypothetical protein BDV97DRAFT_403380 [Delphinella strobiligena]